MLLPFRHRIVVLPDPHRAENRVPQPVHRLIVLRLGEAFLRPFHGGIGCDHPLMLSLNRVPVGLDDGGPLPGHRGQLFRVHALHGVRVLGYDKDPHGQIRHHLLQLFLLPGEHGPKGFLLRIQIVQPALSVKDPFHIHLPGPGFVAFLNHQLREAVLLHGDGQLNHLARTHVRPRPHNQLRVLLKQFPGYAHVSSS